MAPDLTAGRVFVDSTVLVYAEDRRDPLRLGIAVTVLSELWASGRGVLSTQVLQEFYNVATRKLRMSPEAARRIVAEYAEWPAVETTVQLIVSASILHERHSFSFWDSMVVEAALLSGATTLLSEDLQDERRIGGLTISNPFRADDGQ